MDGRNFQPGTLSHFAINADDVNRARRFYEAVLGWQFTPWGPPDFFKITTASCQQPGPLGVLQKRRDLIPGTHTIGFECTIAVQDLDAVADAIVEHGGRILTEKHTIPEVGRLVFFADPAGNVMGAMQYD